MRAGKGMPSGINSGSDNMAARAIAPRTPPREIAAIILKLGRCQGYEDDVQLKLQRVVLGRSRGHVD